MVFSSPIFLFLFLPVALGLYFVQPRITRNAILLAASLFFYSWGEQFLVWIVVTSTFIDFAAGLAIAGGEREPLPPGSPRTRRQKTALVVSVCSNLAFLFYFKYFNFGLDSFNAMVPASWGLHDIAKIALPIGISFYTFQSLSYTVDVRPRYHRGRAAGYRDLRVCRAMAR